MVGLRLHCVPQMPMSREDPRRGPLQVAGRCPLTPCCPGTLPAGVIVVELLAPRRKAGLNHYRAVGTGALVRLGRSGDLLAVELGPMPLSVGHTAIGVADAGTGAGPRGVQFDDGVPATRQVATDKKLFEPWPLSLHSHPPDSGGSAVMVELPRCPALPGATPPPDLRIGVDVSRRSLQFTLPRRTYNTTQGLHRHLMVTVLAGV